MTTKADDIKLPELPVGFFKHHIAGFDGPVYAEMQMEAYARAAVEANRPADGQIVEDALIYGIGVSIDGKRIAPQDFYMPDQYEADRQGRMPIDQIDGMADTAYGQYIQQMRSRECLGWEQKVKTGQFGEAELKAHTRAGEFLGRHRAFSECVEILSRYGSSQPAASAQPTRCEDCPPVGYPTDKTRCAPCDRRADYLVCGRSNGDGTYEAVPTASPAGSPADAIGFKSFDPDDRFFHASDKSWWRRGDDGMLIRADAPQPAANAEPGETEALRDMLDDARSDLEMLRNALGVPVEPHQNLLERMLDAAKVAAPVAQEPVAWANWKVGTKSYVPYRTEAEASASVRQSEIAATQDGPYRVVSLGVIAAPTPPAVEQPNEIPAFMELIGWQVIQKNGLFVGGIARSDEERESMMRSKHLFNPEIDTFRPVYAFQATPPAVEQASIQQWPSDWADQLNGEYRQGLEDGRKEAQLSGNPVQLVSVQVDKSSNLQGSPVDKSTEMQDQPSAQDREDTERYRYLRTENAKPYERDGCLAVVYDDKEGGAWVGCDLDAAIDVARKKQP